MQSPSGNGSPPAPRLNGTFWLLAVVCAMAVATSATLWWTLRQTQALAQPYQQSGPWYVSSVHSELARVSLLARKAQAGQAELPELQERLDVLLATLDRTGRGPQVVQQTILDSMPPDTVSDLDVLFRQVDAWSDRMHAPGADGAALAQEIIDHSDGMLDMARRAVAAVHLVSNEQTDEARQQMHRSFLVLSAVLGGLLAGAALLVWRLAHGARTASALSQQLAQANRELEKRVADRTRKIEEGRALLNYILDTSPSDVVLAEAQSGHVHFINHQLTERLGLKAPPRTLFLRDLLHDPATRDRFMRTLDEYGQVDAMEAQIGEHAPRWSSLSARLIEVDGQLAHLLWGFDIETHKALEAQLRELATRDALSGLLNRRAFMERATALYNHCRRHAQPCSVLMIDIDHFKLINDRHGHQSGDEAIRACAQAAGLALRDADLLGRLGGEEFAALLPHSTAASALRIAERIRGAIAQIDLPTPQGPMAFTVSIGVAELAPHHAGIEPLLAEADEALYRAKAAGRNKVLAYAPAIPHHNGEQIP